MVKSRILLFDYKFFLCEKKDGYSKREKQEIIDLHVK